MWSTHLIATKSPPTNQPVNQIIYLYFKAIPKGKKTNLLKFLLPFFTILIIDDEYLVFMIS